MGASSVRQVRCPLLVPRFFTLSLCPVLSWPVLSWPGLAAGIPLSIIVKDFGWSAYFTTLIGACAVALLLLSPMTRLRSYVQREEVRMAREAGAKKEQ